MIVGILCIACFLLLSSPMQSSSALHRWTFQNVAKSLKEWREFYDQRSWMIKINFVDCNKIWDINCGTPRILAPQSQRAKGSDMKIIKTILVARDGSVMGFISTCNNDRIIEISEPTKGLQLTASLLETLITSYPYSQRAKNFYGATLCSEKCILWQTQQLKSAAFNRLLMNKSAPFLNDYMIPPPFSR